MSKNNIRIKVPCNEIVKHTLLLHYSHVLYNSSTLIESKLDIKTAREFNSRHSNQHSARTTNIYVILDKETSLSYQSGKTEKLISAALERHAYDILLIKMHGAFLVSQSVSRSLNAVIDVYELSELRIYKEGLRKIFWRDRKKRNMV